MRAVAGQTHLYQHHNGYFYFRIVIPADLVEFLGDKPYKRSFKTRDKALARQYCRISSNRAEWAFSAIREFINGRNGMSHEDIKQAARNHFEKCLFDGEFDLYCATTGLINSPLKEPDEQTDPEDVRRSVRHLRENSQRVLQWLQEHSRDYSFSGRHKEIAAELRDHFGITAPEDSNNFVDLCYMVVRAQLEAERIKQAYFSGNPLQGEIQDPLFRECRNYFQHPHPYGGVDREKPYIAMKETVDQTTLQQAAKQYVDFRRNSGTSDKRVRDIRSFLDKLTEYLGADIAVSSLTKKVHGPQIMDMVLKFPANYKTGQENGLRNIIHGGGHYEKIKPATGIVYWTVYKDFFAWCVEREVLERSPLEGLKFSKPKPEEGRRAAFKPEHLQAIFQSPIYTGRKNRSNAPWEPGSTVYRDGFFWVPLVAMYSGLRMGEILSLYPSDIRTDGSVLYIDVNKDVDGKSLKNEQSARHIPVHPDLLEMGFSEYCDKRRREAKSGERLFGDVINIPENNPSKYYTNRFSAYLVNIGIKKKDGSRQDRNIVFHAFRHTYVSALRRIPGITDEAMNDLDGREGNSGRALSSRRLYGSHFSPAELYPYVCQMKYDVDLSHLKVP